MNMEYGYYYVYKREEVDNDDEELDGDVTEPHTEIVGSANIYLLSYVIVIVIVVILYDIVIGIIYYRAAYRDRWISKHLLGRRSNTQPNLLGTNHTNQADDNGFSESDLFMS